MNWTRRSYDATGLTQYPVGRHLRAVQDGLAGSVFLCLDVSGSMSGSPLRQAVEGCRRFVSEALDAHYSAGILYWDSGVVGHTAVTHDRGTLNSFLDGARIAGGTNVVPALVRCGELLDGRRGDLVIAVFGDGDLGDRSGAMREASRLAARNIRIITCGLGNVSAQELSAISSEVGDAPRVANSGQIADAIADMASGLTKRR